MTAKTGPTALHDTPSSGTSGSASTVVYTGGAYPARPVGAAAGVIYIGPVQPTDWITGDLWIKNA